MNEPVPSAMSTMSVSRATATYVVRGMTCAHCVRAVTDELVRLDGVRAVEVELPAEAAAAAEVTVTSDGPLGEEVVRAALDEAGYTLTGTR